MYFLNISWVWEGSSIVFGFGYSIIFGFGYSIICGIGYSIIWVVRECSLDLCNRFMFGF